MGAKRIMSIRRMVSMILGIVCTASLGCAGCLNSGSCGGFGGQVYSGDCCGSCCAVDAACGCPGASCCCPEASCCCPDASCGCPSEVCCGSPVVGRCRLLQRIRNALCGNSGGGCNTYYGDWSCCSTCDSCPCECYGGQGGGYQGPPAGRRPSLAGRRIKLDEALQFAEEDEPVYR